MQNIVSVRMNLLFFMEKILGNKIVSNLINSKKYNIDIAYKIKTNY